MKVINRVLYAALVSIIFMVLLSFVKDQYKTSKLLDIANEVYETKQYERLLPTKYYNKNKLLDEKIVYNDNNYEIIIYEVVYITKNDTYDIDDGLAILLIGNDNTEDSIKLNLLSKEQEENENIINIEYNMSKFSNDVPFYFSSDVNQDIYIKRSNFIKDDIEYELGSITFNDEVVIDSVKINYTLKNEINNYITTYNTLPTNESNTIGITDTLVIDVKKPLIITTIVYIVILIPLTLLIFRIRKKLGKKDITEGLKKDIEKIKE